MHIGIAIKPHELSPMVAPLWIRGLDVIQYGLVATYVARTLLSWSRVMSKTCPTCVSDTRVVCILKN